MYKVGDIIRYSQSGICRIDRIEKLDFSGTDKEYFVLIPLRKTSSTVFVPLESEALLSKITNPITPAEIDKMIIEVQKECIEWIKDFRKRCDLSKKILQSNNRKEIVLLIKAIYKHKKELEDEGKYIHNSDDYILKDAEELIFGEISYVLGKDYFDVQNYMRNILLK